MSNTLKLKYKVGEIEFEAEGPADAVEQQRVNFMNAVLPAAVDAMARTRTVMGPQMYMEASPEAPFLEAGDSAPSSMDTSAIDLSRTSLVSFVNKHGTLGDQDFTLFAAYFDEKKNGTRAFSIENVRQYYAEGRKPPYSNNSELLRQLVKKGYIMDTQAPADAKAGKYFTLTEDGIKYVETYVPKEETAEKKRTHAKGKKAATKASTTYSSITADDLNLKSYPAIKSLSSTKEQVIMAMYIVSTETKNDWFTVDDIIYLLVNIFEVPANIDMVNGVFKRNKSMFTSQQDPNNKKAYQRKLLSGAKDFASELIGKVHAE